MSILITTDLHWNDQPRDRYRHLFVHWLTRQITKHDVKTLLILGDLTEEKDRHGAWLVTQVFQHIAKLSRLAEVIILRGNHDYLLPSMPFFQSLGRLNNVRWINEPTVLENFRLGPTLFLPHTRDHVKDWAEVDLRACHYVFTHNTFAGAKSETGYELDGIPRSVFSRRQRVYSGDVHSPQTVGQIVYVGSPYHIDFGDGYRPRVLLLADGEEKSIVCKGPRKLVVDLGLKDDLDGHIMKGDLLKVRIHLEAGDTHDVFHAAKERVLEHAAEIGCVVWRVLPVVDRSEAVISQGSRRVRRRSDRRIMEVYVDTVGAKASVLKTGLRLAKIK